MSVIDTVSWKVTTESATRETQFVPNVRWVVGGHLTLQVGFTIIYIIRSMTAYSMRSECYKAPPFWSLHGEPYTSLVQYCAHQLYNRTPEPAGSPPDLPTDQETMQHARHRETDA